MKRQNGAKQQKNNCLCGQNDDQITQVLPFEHLQYMHNRIPRIPKYSSEYSSGAAARHREFTPQMSHYPRPERWFGRAQIVGPSDGGGEKNLKAEQEYGSR